MTTNEADFLHYLKTRDIQVTGQYGIPVVKGIKFKSLSNIDLIGFNCSTSPKNIHERGQSIVHFFLPDEYSERVWNRPDDYEAVFNQYRGIIQPDFSQYVGMPKAMLIWQHYRRMFIAQYYQNKGLRVIPAPCWSDEDSFEYCFDGMPKNSCLCISSVGCVQNPKVRERFNAGFQETLDRLTPSQVIMYGVLDDDMRKRLGNTPYVHIESEQKQRIKIFKNKA